MLTKLRKSLPKNLKVKNRKIKSQNDAFQVMLGQDGTEHRRFQYCKISMTLPQIFGVSVVAFLN